MGTTKVKITRKATKKNGSTQGTVANKKKSVVTPTKVTTSKARITTKKGGVVDVGFIKGS